MRAYLIGGGMQVNVFPQEKEKSKLECVVNNEIQSRLHLHITPEYIQTRAPEEEGFHIVANSSTLYEATQIDIFLSEKHWKKITSITEITDDNGAFESRCKYDRVCISYLPL